MALSTSKSLEEPIAYSLLSWARARPGDRIPAGASRNGWWGDTYADEPGDEFGSRLWTLIGMAMSKALPLAETYSTEALGWMVEDGLVESFSVEASDVGENTCLLTITGRPTGSDRDTVLAAVRYVI